MVQITTFTFSEAEIVKCVDHNKSLVFVFVDFQKLLVAISRLHIFKALICINHHFFTLLNYIYENALAKIRAHVESKSFCIGRGVGQVVTISPKLFTCLVEYMCKACGTTD